MKRNVIASNKSFCILPFIQISIRSKGRVSVCCRSKTIGNFYDEPLLAIWNNNRYKKIREKILKGEKPKECKNCWKIERVDNLSYRLLNIKKGMQDRFVKQLEQLKPDYSMPNQVKILDIGYTGLCNLRCRMCDYFIKKDKFKDLSRKKTRDILNKNLSELVPYLKIVRLTGGEPFVNPNHDFILEKLLPSAHKISLEYSTNLSFNLSDNKRIFELWKKFKEITIVFSLDGVGAVNNYIRIGSNYEDIINNVSKCFEFKNVNKIVCSFTFQALNAFDLPNIVRYLIKESKIIFYCNILYAPDFLNVHIFSKKIKQDLIKLYITLKKEIKAYNVGSNKKNNYTNNIDMLIAYLKEPIDNSRLVDEFIKYNLKIDEKYKLKKSFKEIVPELEFIKNKL